jgi:hypothetical protein
MKNYVQGSEYWSKQLGVCIGVVQGHSGQREVLVAAGVDVGGQEQPLEVNEGTLETRS